MLDFKNFKFLTVEKVEMHQSAKFRRNRFNCGRDMVIFRFFKMAAAAILNFSNLKFLTFVTVNRVELHHLISSKLFDPRPRYVSFSIMLVWLENTYLRHFFGFFGGTFPQVMSLIAFPPKRTILGLNHVI